MALSNKIFYLAGFLLLGLGLILHLVGLATPEWSSYNPQFNTTYGIINGHFTVGLWKVCNALGCRDYIFVEFVSTTDRVISARVFAIIGVGFGMFAGFILLVNLIVSLSGRPAIKFFVFGSVACCCAAFGTVIASISVWASDDFGSSVIRDYLSGVTPTASSGVTPGASLLSLDVTPGYSFILSIVGGILMLAGGIIGCIGFKSGQSVNHDHSRPGGSSPVGFKQVGGHS